MRFTPSQQQAIDVTRRADDACVVAGPGSGKTTVLVEYFRRLVESGVDPLRILAITFTEKAASNMRAKLAAAFANDAALRGKLERAYVSTVHGFCARLLRENAIFAGIDPEFYVMDDRESARLQSLAIDNTLDGMLARDPAATLALMRSLSSPDCASAILSVYDAMRAAGEPVAHLDRYPEPPGPSLEHARALVAAIRAESTAGWSAAQCAQLAEVLACCDRICETDPLAPLACNLNKLKRGSLISELVKELREVVLPEVQRGILTERMRPMRATLRELLDRFDAAYREAKRQLGGLDYADLEEFTVRLLEANPDVRARIQSQFDQVLMDEFQDTNGQQASLLELVRPPGRFYAVGDINQSIYGFRHANPDVFRNYRDGIERSGKRLVDLAENFRSRPGILRAVETILSGAAGIEPRTLIPAQEFAPEDDPSVEILIASGDDAAEIEPRLVARRIVELQRTLRVGKDRPAEFRDFAVLVRNSEVLAAFTAAFDDAGIPYLVNRGKGFYETREVVDLAQLLRILVNPRDEISLAAVLRSPFVDLSDEAIFRLKQSGNLATALRQLPGDAAAAYDPADWEKLRRFREQLPRWRAAIGYQSFDRLLLAAIEETGYPWDAAPRAAGNIEKFLAQARDASGRQTLAEFVEDLQLIRAGNPREPEAPPADSVNAVEIMTVHSAKGLEYPVVFVSALQKGTDTSLGAVSFSPRIGLGASWRNPKTGKSVDDRYQNAIKQERRQRDEQESNRLFYVAMTRAEERLVLSLAAAKNWGAILANSLGLDVETPREEVLPFHNPAGECWQARIHCTGAPPETPDRPELAETAAAIAYLPRPELPAQYDSNANVTSINAFANCPRRYYLSYYLGLEGRPAAPRDGDAPARTTAEFGREVHALLAGEDVAAPEPDAVELASRFPSSPLGREAAAAPHVEREFDFLLAVDDLVLRGQIDLWYEANGELVLVDYKTDRVTAAEAPTRAEGYAVQLRLYALALQRLTGRAPARVFLYFLRPDVAVPVAIAPALLAEAEQVVRDFRDAQSTLAFPLREAPHCRVCPHARAACPAAIVR